MGGGVGVATLVLISLCLPELSHAHCPTQCSCPATTVRCTGGSLSHVPHFLNPDIEMLDLSDNRISKLEGGFTFYLGLKKLNLSGNSLASLGRGQFSSQTSLAQLDLSHNSLAKLRSGAFAGLAQLSQL